MYDQYRAYLSDAAQEQGWNFVDLWDVFPESSFADTPLHLIPDAHRALAQMLAPEILKMCE